MASDSLTKVWRKSPQLITLSLPSPHLQSLEADIGHPDPVFPLPAEPSPHPSPAPLALPLPGGRLV